MHQNERETERKVEEFQPFEESKRGVRRHWEWLRRWLLANVRICLALLMLVILAAGLAAGSDLWLPMLKALGGRSAQPANSIEVRRTSAVPAAGADDAGGSAHAAAPTNAAAAVPVTLQDGTPKTRLVPADHNETEAVRKSSARPEPNSERILFSRPLEGRVTRTYGLSFADQFGDYRFHQGIDIMPAKTFGVRAAAEGTVSEVTVDPAEGRLIVIGHRQKYLSYYENLKSVKVVKGQKVRQGQLIGEADTAGGPLHFALKKGQQGLNPLQYLSF